MINEVKAKSSGRSENSATQSRTFRTFLLVREFEKRQIGERIAQARHEAGLTQEELAEAVGVSQRAVQLWEAGDNVPFRRLSRIGEIVGRSVLWLIHGDDQADTTRLQAMEERLEELDEKVDRILDLLGSPAQPEPEEQTGIS